jgi:hypothetical protein
MIPRIAFIVLVQLGLIFPVLAQDSTFSIQRSNVIALSSGRLLQRHERIELGKDDEVTLIVRTGDQVVQRVCAGPYTGPVGDCAASCSLNARLLGKCANGPVGVPGGSREFED